MAEKPGYGNVAGHFVSPILSKGMGVLGLWQSFDGSAVGGSLEGGELGQYRSLADSGRATGLGQDPVCIPVEQLMGPETSTPNSIDAVAIHHLTDMVGQLGSPL